MFLGHSESHITTVSLTCRGQRTGRGKTGGDWSLPARRTSTNQVGVMDPAHSGGLGDAG